MAKLSIRVRKYVTPFRKLRKGSVYYKDSDSTGPFVKAGAASILATNALPVGSGATLTAAADTSIATVKIGKFTLRSQEAV